ncbi:MAG: hypothetical protein ABIG28_02445 [archaeon]
MGINIKKKNILDLQFQKYLVIASTSVIVAFTYFVGVGIAFFTNQIRFNDFVIVATLFFISIGVLGACALLFYNALFHLRNIPMAVKDL